MCALVKVPETHGSASGATREQHDEPSTASILIVSPVRNEAAHIERVVRAVAGQELTPARWIVIDDGSDDATLEILRSLEPGVPCLEVVNAGGHAGRAVGDRLARALEAVNFNRGLALADRAAFTHIMKLDGDIELPPDHLARMMERFAANPRLGIAGCVLDEPLDSGGRRRIGIPSHHVHGAVKCYSLACFEAIGGIRETLGWDTIDETYARMRGFETRTFREAVSTHHRPIGSADGTLRGHARHGQCAYIVHYTPTWVALRAAKVATRRPRILSGGAFLYGYVGAACRRTDRLADDDFRRFTRSELRRRILRAPRRLVGGRGSGPFV
jgi:biofilm PGA synthesis N-glycosyltransferase PgaC